MEDIQPEWRPGLPDRDTAPQAGFLTNSNSLDDMQQVSVFEEQKPLLQASNLPPSLEDDHLGGREQPASSSGRDAFEIEVAIDEASVRRRISWHILPAFFSLAMLCSIDRSNLSFAASQLNHDLHFSDEVYGLGSGIFFVGYAVFAIPSTFVCASVGAPVFLGSIMIVWGLTAALFSAMQNSWQFFMLRFILGLAESGAYPGMWYHLALFYTEQEIGPAYTIVATATSLSGVAGGPLAGELLELDGVLGLQGWQWLFLLEALPAVLLGIAILLCLAKSPATATFLQPDERQWLQCRKEGSGSSMKTGAHLADDQLKEEQRESYLATFTAVVKEWRIWWLGLIWSIVCFGMDGLIFWIPLLIQGIIYGKAVDDLDTLTEEEERVEINGHAVHTARLASIPFGLAALGMVALAYSAKRTGDRHWHIAIPMLLGTGVLVALPLVEGSVMWLAFALLSLGCVCVWAPHGPLLSWPAAILQGTAAATGFALIKMMGSFASFAGSAAIGELHHVTGGYAAPVFLLAGLLAIGSALTVAFSEPGRASKLGALPIFAQLRNRLGMKRSRSDPTSDLPPRRFTGSLSTIREDLARPHHNPAALYDMPGLPVSLGVRPGA